ncbi:PAS domain-containing sensor histidine kinase [Pseudomonas asplenii]|uniref:PAS domain-containing sensor histidine kinase n=1 Tax=Pseudomonas asplenii TaxID=53407 RepID=UPI0022348A07|nr:PAS domain-containing sensor histidine kinase [Pseudomonas asplenii]UZE29761.1 PAS domain-containing protein [Pseudomonas asplenii]
MSSGEKLFGRLLGRGGGAQPSLVPLVESPASAAELRVRLDGDGRVLEVSGPLRHGLAAVPHDDTYPLRDLLAPSSHLSVEGVPADWLGQSLDLDFNGLAGQVVHTRGWLQPHQGGWLLQAMDIGDLLKGSQTAETREYLQHFAARMSEQLRLCSLARLPQVLSEQIQSLAQRWHVPCLALALLDEPGQQWQIHSHYRAHDAPPLWHDGQALGSGLDSLNGMAPLRLEVRDGLSEHPRLLTVMGNADGLLVPFRDEHGVAAWLLCGFYPVRQRAPQLSDQDWLQLAAALAAPLLGRRRQQSHQQQLERLELLQGLLGTGWWEWSPARDQIQLAASLAQALGLGESAALSLDDWLAAIHPADREELVSGMRDLQRGQSLLLCVRLYQDDPRDNPRWYRLQGQTLGMGDAQRIVGFMLDISDVKNQEQAAAAAHARLDNLIASSPAVIYVQRYVEGALLPVFFSDSLQPLLGRTLDDCVRDGLAQWIHPEDRDRYFERTRQLLREGHVHCRYRLQDQRGEYHWLLDEARLLRDDLGMPVEAVGLWMDVTEATLAAERIEKSEERYRILVEDSPAMICRYRPDLTLIFGNKPLATYLECAPEQLPGVNLGSWMSPEQHAAFTRRLEQLTPEVPVSTAEISLQLPGREHAWWVWSDRGVFDAQGRLQEIQAVGRDNTEVRRSQQQLTQSAKMATLGEMATGLAHEINQPLNVMRMAIVNVLKRLSNGDVQIDYLQDKLNRIDAQVQRAARVVDHMRVFGRRSEVEAAPFNPAQAVEGTLSLLSEGMKGKGVQLRVPPIEFEVQVRGFVDQLEQVLINLMVNARDALLSKREKNRDFEPWISVTAEHDERAVRLIVEDNGGGIDPRLLERIFEPFFTTKPVGIGTGLGLSVSYGIVENMGGRMSVRNGDDGARFCVELPLVLDH